METNQTKQTQEPIELKQKITSEFSDNNWCVIAHLSAFAAFIIPIGSILGPLIVYLISSDKPHVREHAKAALNFNITFTLAFFVAMLSLLIGIGVILVPLVGISWIILVVLGAVKAGENQLYKYPVTINFIK